MINQEPRRAYAHSVSYTIDHMNEPIHERYCSECGCKTTILDIDNKQWDRLCYHCRNWTRGVIAWCLRYFGWELHILTAGESDEM